MDADPITIKRMVPKQKSAPPPPRPISSVSDPGCVKNQDPDPG